MGINQAQVRFEDALIEPVRNGIYKQKQFHGTGVKIVNMGELFSFPRLKNVPMKRVELTKNERERFLLSKGDLLFARRSLVAEGAGKCCIVLDVQEPTTFESSIIRARPDTGIADSLYLFYFFSSPLGVQALDSIRRQVSVAGITGSDLSKLILPLPPLSEQRAIAHILGTLDDKIELNRKMNETLEAMARALFKCWFVDFGPVRAKAEGQDTGLPKEIADLFPDEFEDSELGEIPKGWKVVPIEELTEIVGGSTPSTQEPAYWEGGNFNWATPKDLSNLKTPVLLGTERKITEKGLKRICSGLLPPGSILFSSRAPIGYRAICEIPVAINQGFIGMLPREGISNLFLLYWAESAYDEILSRANGSTFMEISKGNFRKIQVIKSPRKILDTFQRLLRPIFLRLVSNEREILTLISIRDALTPRLISGEIRVKEDCDSIPSILETKSEVLK